jgi:hypothetical protein
MQERSRIFMAQQGPITVSVSRNGDKIIKQWSSEPLTMRNQRNKEIETKTRGGDDEEIGKG